MIKNPNEWRAKRYHNEFREHWGVFFHPDAPAITHLSDCTLVDCSPIEYDVELRSCSLCEIPGSIVVVRHCLPYVTTEGVKRWRVTDTRVRPLNAVGGGDVPPDPSPPDDWQDW